jgi:DNA uptake protein ComE-like DNA-binding protein
MKIPALNPFFVIATPLLALGLNAQEPKPTPTASQAPAAHTQLETKASPKATASPAKGASVKPKDQAAPSDPKSPKGSTKPAQKATKKPTAPPPNYMLGEAAPVPAKKPMVKPQPQPRAKARSRSAKPTGPRLDINTATKEELKTLPGIFDAEADKILAKRPYKSKAGLLVDAGLTGAQYFGIKDRVFAGAPPMR